MTEIRAVVSCDSNMFGRSRLGDADQMFRRFFDRWYDDEARELRVFKATRPDMLTDPTYAGRPASDICEITPEVAAEALKRVRIMCEAAAGDWPTYLKVRPPIDLTWVATFDEYYDRGRVADLARRSDPKDFSNDYVVIVCEFGAVLGLVITQLLPGLEWLPSWPYWESAIVDSKSGTTIPVFHWAIKKFSTYALDDGFAEKMQACVQLLRKRRRRGH